MLYKESTGIRVVKSFVRENFEVKSSAVSQNEFTKHLPQQRGIVAYNMPLMQFAVYSCLLFLCWFGAKIIVLTQGTTMTTGELSSLIAYAMNILNCLLMLSQVLVMINMARASSERIIEILDEESSLKNRIAPVYDMPNGEIIFENVGFSYLNDMNKECLSNISLHIPSGSTLGIIGATGSGKTSLVQLIPRLYDVTGKHLYRW